ncbi:MAG: hypothetical protein ONB24_14810, partial [candidate division KSB1 bacterium]|nr:hypothetical protein [candidate division KSB1 bacterium]
MGESAPELRDSQWAIMEEAHEVLLTEDFYLGVFAVTQKQWELIMGANPSFFKGDSRPVENVTWEDICVGQFELRENISGTYLK